ncbi:unnamed protein product, partial [Oikopleura dioica]
MKSHNPKKWSWLVRIDGCHGALVSQQFVVTAPACCVSAVGKRIFFADKSFNTVDKVIVNLESTDIRDQICLIKLQKPVRYSDSVYPICTDDGAVDVARAVRAFSKNTLDSIKDHAVDMLPPVMCPRLGDNDQPSTCIVGPGQNSFTEGFCARNLGAPIVAVHKKAAILIGIVTHPFGDCDFIQGFSTQIGNVEKWIKQNIKFHENFWSFSSDFQQTTTGFELSGKSMLAEMGQNQCESKIDGFGRSGASLVRSLQQKIILEQIASGNITAEESEFAGKLPPRDMRTIEFWEDFEQRVVGSNVEPQENPWTWMVDFDGTCAGALISAEVAVTSAMCCGFIDHDTAYIGGFSARESGVKRTISQKIISPDFSQAKLRNDLCLVSFTEPLEIGANLRPICLPANGFALDEGEHLFIAGWGSKTVSGALSENLNSAALPIVAFEKCEKEYGDLGLELSDSAHFCANSPNGGIGPCRGDWGAPSVVMRAGQPVLAGKEMSVVQTTTTSTTSTTTTSTTSAPAAAMLDENFNGVTGGSCESVFDSMFSSSGRSSINGDVPFQIGQKISYADYSNSRERRSIFGGRLVGGEKVEEIGEWPFAVNIAGKCGGSLIGRRWVLTAAHCCTDEILTNSSTITIGSNFLRDATADELFSAEDFISHPSYNDFNYNNDICVIKLDRDVIYSATVSPVCLDESIAHNGGFPNFIAGWGQTKAGGVKKNFISEATVESLRRSECKEFLPDEFLKHYGESSISKDQFCAGYSSGSVDACKSDVGGPFMTINKEAGQRKLSGIISWSRGCGQVGRPAVYSKISSYANWIFETIRDVDAPISIGISNEFAVEAENDNSNPDFNLASERVFSKLNIKAGCMPSFGIQGAKTFEKSDTKSWPWAVNINLQCSGTLIDTNMVLTSAFCCQSVSPNDITNTRVNMGSKKAIGKMSVRMHSFAINPRFSNVGGIRKNDICIIRLVRHVDISLPKANTPVYTAGWPAAHGGFKKGAKTIVERVNKKLSIQECRKIYNGKIEDDQICVQQLPDKTLLKKSPCAKDVGAPVIVLENGEPKLLGLMGKHRNCVEERNYFTSVLEHNEWITAKVTNQHISIPALKHNRLFDNVEDYSCPSMTDHLNQFGHIFGARSVRDPSGILEEGSGEDRTDGFEIEQAADRIDNGNAVERAHWPFIGNLHNFCTATLIGREYAITTASCCNTALNRNIFFGQNIRRDDSSDFQGFVEDIRKHPDFDLDTRANDICVLRIDRSVEYSSKIKPVCLNPTDIEEFSTAFIAGWDSSKRLREGDVIIKDFDTCNVAYSMSLNKKFSFCARGKEEENEIDECATDVGAPLIHVVNGRPLLSGIMSFGDTCGDESLPGIYTKVASFVDWIVEAAEDMAVKPTTTTTTTTTPELSPQQQAGYSSSWPGFSLEDFSFNCRTNLASMNDSHVDNASVSVNAHTATIENSCAATLVTETHLLTSMTCCSDIIGKFILFQDGQQKRVVNTRVHDSGLCMIELPNPVALSSEVYPI